jgi:NTE family protein
LSPGARVAALGESRHEENMAHEAKTGLVLTGGGARAAYQIGVLKAVQELLPPGCSNPFPIICGTSAGAINAAALAVYCGDFAAAVRQLCAVWENFHAHHVYRSDTLGVMRCGARWLAALLLGGLGKNNPVSLLDSEPLGELLRRTLDLARIDANIDSGALYALSITASGYSTGQSVSFFQGAPEIASWQRSQRIGLAARIGIEHLMASSAIPFIFPPHRINREFFGDGSMRQIAPISPALHLGASRVLVVGTERMSQEPPERTKADLHPSLAQIAGHVLNSIFLDSLAVELERLQRINRTISLVPRERLAANNISLHYVDVMMLSPSVQLSKIALGYVRHLPRPIRFLLRGVGATSRNGANLASYLLFESAFCRALIDLGYSDTLARRDEVLAFFSGAPRADVASH